MNLRLRRTCSFSLTRLLWSDDPVQPDQLLEDEVRALPWRPQQTLQILSIKSEQFSSRLLRRYFRSLVVSIKILGDCRCCQVLAMTQCTFGLSQQGRRRCLIAKPMIAFHAPSGKELCKTLPMRPLAQYRNWEAAKKGRSEGEEGKRRPAHSNFSCCPLLLFLHFSGLPHSMHSTDIVTLSRVSSAKPLFV